MRPTFSFQAHDGLSKIVLLAPVNADTRSQIVLAPWVSTHSTLFYSQWLGQDISVLRLMTQTVRNLPRIARVKIILEMSLVYSKQ